MRQFDRRLGRLEAVLGQREEEAIVLVVKECGREDEEVVGAELGWRGGGGREVVLRLDGEGYEGFLAGVCGVDGVLEVGLVYGGEVR